LPHTYGCEQVQADPEPVGHGPLVARASQLGDRRMHRRLRRAVRAVRSGRAGPDRAAASHPVADWNADDDPGDDHPGDRDGDPDQHAHQDLHSEGDLVLVESGVHVPSDEEVHTPSDQAVHAPSGDDDDEAIHPAADDEEAPGAAADVPSDRDVLPPGHADGVRVGVGVGFDVDHRCGVRGRWPVRDGVRPGRVVHVVGDRLRR